MKSVWLLMDSTDDVLVAFADEPTEMTVLAALQAHFWHEEAEWDDRPEHEPILEWSSLTLHGEQWSINYVVPDGLVGNWQTGAVVRVDVWPT